MSDYLKHLEEQARIDAADLRAGDADAAMRDVDVTDNVLTGGKVGQTVSVRCALARRAGRWWGILACWFLSWAVQRDHCDIVLQPDSVTPRSVYWRAGACFAIATLAVAGGVGACIYWGVKAGGLILAGAAAAGVHMIQTRPGRR